LPLGWRRLAGAPDGAGCDRRFHVYLMQFLLLAAFLFCVGIYGVLARKNAVLVLMSVELILNSVNINLIALGVSRGYDQAIIGQVFALFVIAVAAAEVGIGLAIVLLIYRNRADIDLTQVDLMKG
jgi:NADH:ubiquinone oxidoreductase subunit K